MMRRNFTRAIAAALFAALALMLGVGWYYAGEIWREALEIDHAAALPDLIVESLGPDSLTLKITASADADYGDWRHPGIFGLEHPAGYARVGAIEELDATRVVRALGADDGLSVGSEVNLDAGAFSGDPLTALNLPFDTVTIKSEVGPLGAWQVPGTSNTWAIFVHGRTSTREEALRALKTIAAQGVPSLVIQYRNDEGVGASASGIYDYGQSEWRDLEAAVRHALDQGAGDIVLVGFSMGGGIVANFLYRSDLASRVRALILDAPVLDFGDVVDFGAERRNLPKVLTWLGKTAATLRFGLSWRKLDYLSRAERLRVPILLFHGDADRLVHVRTSDALAAARPDLVTYHRVAGAGHGRAWNVDPVSYERALVDFLRKSGVIAGGAVIPLFQAAQRDQRTPLIRCDPGTGW